MIMLFLGVTFIYHAIGVDFWHDSQGSVFALERCEFIIKIAVPSFSSRLAHSVQ